MTEPLTLATREGLPDALQYLIEAYPRDIWTSHHNFDGLTRFWLSRHVEFRRAMEIMQADARAGVEKSQSADHMARRLVQVGQFFTQALHGHHHIEDHHYFPQFMEKEAGLRAGFELLDADHHALDAHLNNLETRLESFQNLLSASDDPARLFSEHLDLLSGFETFLDRHLTDEEDLVVPIILKFGPVE